MAFILKSEDLSNRDVEFGMEKIKGFFNSVVEGHRTEWQEEKYELGSTIMLIGIRAACMMMLAVKDDTEREQIGKFLKLAFEETLDFHLSGQAMEEYLKRDGEVLH